MEDQIMFEREIRQKFDRIKAEMEWGEVLSTLNDMLRDILTPAELAELELNIQPAESQVGGYDEHATEAGACSQEQYNNPPIVRPPEGLVHNLHCDGILSGQLLYEPPPEVLAPPAYAPPAPPTSTLKKRESKQEDDQPPYIKKPPNSFMLFMKEQRTNVEAELNTRGSAAVNAVLGQRWKSLTDEERAKYYEQAQKEKELHALQHPEWTTSNNYGKKKKRVGRKRSASTAEASASRPKEKRLIMAPHTQAGVMNILHLQTGVMKPGPSTALQLPPSWIPVAAPLQLLYHP